MTRPLVILHKTNFTGRLFSTEHNRWFATDNTPLQILRDNNKRLTLTANRIPISQLFCEQSDKLRQSFRLLGPFINRQPMADENKTLTAVSDSALDELMLLMEIRIYLKSSKKYTQP